MGRLRQDTLAIRLEARSLVRMGPPPLDISGIVLPCAYTSAADHAGFELKKYLVAALTDEGHEVVDHGPHDYDAEDDYPVFCLPAAEAVVADRARWASWSAALATGSRSRRTRWSGVRAALACDEDTAKLGRQHNTPT